MAIDALEIVVSNWRRTVADLSQLTHHSNRRIKNLSAPYSNRLAENDTVA